MVVWYGVIWCGMVWYGLVWYAVVWCGLVWFSVVWWVGVVWKIAVCQNRALTRAPEILYGAIGPELRCACGGMGGLWWGVVFGGMVVWYGGMVWCANSDGMGIVWCGMVWYGVVWFGMVWGGVTWSGLV